MNKATRRKFLQNSSLMGSFGLANLTQAQSSCESWLTPAQPTGPFYPEIPPGQWEPDQDLTTVDVSSTPATGQHIGLVASIQDENCQAIPQAELQIWQADHQGVYNHSMDPRQQELTPDTNFQFWARGLTNPDGKISFRTIKPGAYPAGGQWIRPAHIHIRVLADGFLPLISQIYFAPDKSDTYDLKVLSVMPGLVNYYQTQGGEAVSTALHQLDGILRQVPAVERDTVIMKGALTTVTNGSGKPETLLTYALNIKLKKI